MFSIQIPSSLIVVARLSTLMDNLQRLKKYPKIYVPYELLVNIAGKAPRTFCDVLLWLIDVAFAVGTSDSGSLYRANV
jgi:hypothetical protein